MTSDMLADYTEYCRKMWLKNREEREVYNEPSTSLKQYTRDNQAFLENEYARNKGEKNKL